VKTEKKEKLVIGDAKIGVMGVGGGAAKRTYLRKQEKTEGTGERANIQILTSRKKGGRRVLMGGGGVGTEHPNPGAFQSKKLGSGSSQGEKKAQFVALPGLNKLAKGKGRQTTRR